MSFVEINSQEFKNFLESKGFVEASTPYDEVIYEFRHKRNRNLYVKVYTTISKSLNSVRPCGTDAIRVVAVFDNGIRNFGIGKFVRVHRTGTQTSIQERVYTRLVEAYKRCNYWHNENLSRKQ